MKTYLTASLPPNIEKELPIFAQQKFLKNFGSSHSYILMEKEGRPVAVVAISIKTRALFRWCVFTSNIVCLDHNTLTRSEKREFLNASTDLLREDGLDFIAQPFQPALFDVVPTKEKVLTCSFGTYELDLAPSEEDLIKKQHRNCRRAIQKAKEEGLKVVEGEEYLPEISSLIDQTNQRAKMSGYGYEKLKAFKKEMGDNLKCYGVFFEKEMQASVIVAWNYERAFSWVGGSVDHQKRGSSNLMYWRAMVDLKALGVKKFDFMGARLDPPPGSKWEGIQTFKARFGCELKRGYLWKCILRPRKYTMYSSLRRIYSMLKGLRDKGDIIDQESDREKEKSPFCQT